jgi:release factor glutamine methyltransferase
MDPLHDELLTRLSSSWQGLPDKPEENPENTLRALWLFAAGEPRAVQYTEKLDLPHLDEQGANHLRQLVDQRIAGVPLAHLTGRQSFMGIEMLAGPRAMIPRKETEIVGRAALAVLRRVIHEHGFARVLDLCTGSGNLALALASYEKRCQVIGADLSDEALDLAKHNAEYLGLADRAEFWKSDLYESFESDEFWNKFDVVVCNPPYISSAQVSKLPGEISGFEPRLAFDGGAFGVSVLMRLIRQSPRFLKPNSWLCFEIGLGQHEGLERVLERTACYSDIQTHTDEQGAVRALVARTCSH